MLHERFDGTKALLWKKRKLDYSVLEKPLRQALVADGKAVNVRVNEAIIRRNTGHKPSANHPWKKPLIDQSTKDSRCANP